MMCVCRFITCNKCTALVRGLDNEGGYAYVPQGHKELDTTEVTKHAGTHKHIWGAGVWEISPSCWLNGKESTYTAGDTGPIPGSGRSSGVENGNPLQDSGLGNSMDREDWWATYLPQGHKSQTLNNKMWEISVFSPQFCCVSKTDLKIVSTFFLNSLLPKAYKEGKCLIF